MTRNEFAIKGFELMGHAVIPHRTNKGIYSVGACPNGSPSSWVSYVDSATSWTDCYTKLLLVKGYAEQCPSCDAVSAYAWEDVNYAPLADVDEGAPESERVYHIGAASGFEWECGSCGKSWTPEDSPLTAEVYTH